MPRHFLRRPAARRASAPPRVLPTVGLYDLTTAHFTYSRLQLDLLFYLISILDEATATQPLELKIRDLSIATARNLRYPYVAAVAEAMVTQPLTIRGEQDQYQPLHLFAYVHSRPEQRTLQIQLTPAGIPYLLQLRGLIPAPSMPMFLRLTSSYTKRIYLLCRRYRAQGRTPTFSVIGFRQILGLIDEQGHERQKGFGTFHHHILGPAVAQINATTDLRIAYQLEKRGQAVCYLTFTIS